MKMRLAAHGIELSGDLKDYVKRRVHFSLGRFAARIRSLSVRLGDVNGPRGGVDKCCDIRVDVGLRQKVIVREQQANLHAAVAFATERAERAVQRQLKLANTGSRMDTAQAPNFGG
jgi:ribosome-associated translation inhibitor RaiA